MQRLLNDRSIDRGYSKNSEYRREDPLGFDGTHLFSDEIVDCRHRVGRQQSRFPT